MTRTHIALLIALGVAIPAATAGAFMNRPGPATPCFMAGATGFQMTSGTADVVVRIDNASDHPSLRLQLVDDPSAADFILVDDGTAAGACGNASAIKRVKLDLTSAKPDLTVALSRSDAAAKIFVRSAAFSEQDAAALFAAIWQTARATGRGGKFAAVNAER